MNPAISAITATLFLAACATPTLNTPLGSNADVAREAALQRQFVVETQRDQQIELYSVVYRLSTAAADLCSNDKTAGVIGVVMMSAKMFSGAYQAGARSALGLDDGLTIVAVMQDSPAERAGLTSGDHILAIDGDAVADARHDAAALQRSFTQQANVQLPVIMTVRRNGVQRSFNVTPARACYFQASIESSDVVNASSDGTNVSATKGMMNFVKSDEELALVMSHEIAHNILDHLGKKRENQAIGALAGALIDIAVAAKWGVNPGLSRTGASIGAKAYSVQFEQEADYEGLYIMRRAGYSLDNAANFWRRMAAEDPKQITLRSTHPTSAERFVALGIATDEISAKEAQGVALLPDAKPGQARTQLASVWAPPTNRTVSLTTGRQPSRNLSSASVSGAQARTGKKAERLSLGVQGGTVTRYDTGSAAFMTDPHGAWIDSVSPGSVAERAGIRRADIIQTFNGHRVSSFEELNDYVSETAPGSTVRLGVWRKQEVLSIPVEF